MVEEIRTYLLNDINFSKVSYLDSNYAPKRLNETFANFRNLLLIGNNITEPEIQVWRADLLIDAIYRDMELSAVALRNFDRRLIPEKNINKEEFLPSVRQSFYDDRVLIKIDKDNYPQDGIYNKTIVLRKKTQNILDVNFFVGEKQYGRSDQLIFTFKGNMSNFVQIPETRLKIGLSYSSQIPFNLLELKLKYPYFFDINGLIDNVFQIPGIENLMWLNKKSFEEVFEIYSKSNRPYKKLLCLILAYAISLKWQ
jgi:hypothetical protein